MSLISSEDDDGDVRDPDSVYKKAVTKLRLLLSATEAASLRTTDEDGIIHIPGADKLLSLSLSSNIS